MDLSDKNSKSEIPHRGVVTKVEGARVTVALSLDSAECAGCQMAAMCNRPEQLRLRYSGATQQLVGKQVLVSAAPAVRRLAQWCYLGIPVGLILASLVVCHLLGATQRVAALASLGAPALWYAALYLLRHKLDFSSRFSIMQIL